MTFLFYCYFFTVLTVAAFFYICAHNFLGNGLTVNFTPAASNGVIANKHTADFVAIAIATILLVLYFATTVPSNFFFNPDEWLILTPIFQGGYYKAGIWPSSGRFFPLANQELNLIARFTDSAIIIQSFVLLNFYLNALIFWRLFPNIAARWKVWPTALLLFSPSIFCASQSFIYSERLIITFLLLFIYSIKKYIESNNYKYGLLALACAWSSMFYKETVFLIYFGFSISAITSSIVTNRRTDDKTIKNSWYLFLIVFLVGCFMAGYLFFIPFNNHGNTTYAQKMAIGLFPALSFYLKNDFIFIFFVIFFALRTAFLLHQKPIDMFFCDFIGFGIFISYISYIFLEIKQHYYFSYLDALAITYFLLVINIYNGFNNRVNKFIFIIFPLLIVLSFNLDTQIYRYYHQAAFAYKELTTFLVNYLTNNNEDVNIHLDTIDISQVIGFIRTLEHFGISVKKVSEQKNGKEITINVKYEVKGRFCETGKPWLCVQSKSYNQNDLIIVYFYSQNKEKSLQRYLDDKESYKLIFSSNKEILSKPGPAANVFKKL